MGRRNRILKCINPWSSPDFVCFEDIFGLVFNIRKRDMAIKHHVSANAPRLCRTAGMKTALDGLSHKELFCNAYWHSTEERLVTCRTCA